MDEPIIPLASSEPDPASPPDPSAIPPSAPSPAGYTPPAPLTAPVSPAPDPIPPVSSEPPVTPTPTSAPTPPAGGKHTWVWIFVLLLILGGAGGGYYYYKTRVKSGSSGSSAAKPVADPTLSWETFSVTDFPFTLRYPTGWKVTENYLISPGIDPAKKHNPSIYEYRLGFTLPNAITVITVPVGEAGISFHDFQKEMGGKPFLSYDEAEKAYDDSSLSLEDRNRASDIFIVSKPGDTPVDVAATLFSSMMTVSDPTNGLDRLPAANTVHTDTQKVALGGLSVPVVTVRFKDESATDTTVTKQYFLLKDNHVYSFTAILTVNGDKDRSKEVDQIAATLKVQ